MTKKTRQLPYFNIKNEKEEKEIASFFIKKFKTNIKRKLPQHYLVQTIPFKSLDYIKEKSKNHQYFLKFDIKKYFPSINHQILLRQIPENYYLISQKASSKRMNNYLNNTLKNFLRKSPYNKGIPSGSKLSFILSAIFLLKLDLKIPYPFLRKCDDYLIFCKNKNEPFEILQNLIIPTLKDLDLEINEKKLASGKFHQDKLDFIGFNYFASHFSIKEEKKENFKKTITKITYLNKNKSEKATIKLLNNKILGFGHYYKYAACSLDFKLLDSFIRMRLRRYLFKQRNLNKKEANLFLTNKNLESLKLKSLQSIKEGYNKKLKKPKNKQKTIKTNKKTNIKYQNIEQISNNYQQKQILNELSKLNKTNNIILKKLNKLQKLFNKLKKNNDQ